MSKEPIHITSFPHLEMTPGDIRELTERRKLADDPAYNQGKKWAREHNLSAPAVSAQSSHNLHDEYLNVHRQIKSEARRRYLGDVVKETRFWEGARAWADA